MNIKKIYKHINRGIVLAVVLAIATACYVLIGNVTFKKEADSIKNVVTNYVKDSIALSILPDDANKLDAMITKEHVTKQTKALNEILSKYWVEASRSAFSYGTTVESLKESFKINSEVMIGKPLQGEVKSADIRINEFTAVNRDGEKGAKLDFTFDADIKSAGTPSIFIINDLRVLGWNKEINEINVFDPTKEDQMQAPQEIDRTEKISRISGGGVVKLQKIKGEWKISEISNVYTNNH